MYSAYVSTCKRLTLTTQSYIHVRRIYDCVVSERLAAWNAITTQCNQNWYLSLFLACVSCDKVPINKLCLVIVLIYVDSKPVRLTSVNLWVTWRCLSTVECYCLCLCRCVWDKTVRWIQRPAAAADSSERFEFVLERYWADVTQMSLQCALTVCSDVPDSHQHLPPVCTSR